ncbi:hypothetical protein [Microbacterium sp. K24]|uniref:hypothetical protein n=1 Tax=Microbacterium sp. K24 TaxID=2305446 RepID=UPI00109D231F|nr:hypothetical protein [Microbacterium sp. K24]
MQLWEFLDAEGRDGGVPGAHIDRRIQRADPLGDVGAQRPCPRRADEAGMLGERYMTVPSEHDIDGYLPITRQQHEAIPVDQSEHGIGDHDAGGQRHHGREGHRDGDGDQDLTDDDKHTDLADEQCERDHCRPPQRTRQPEHQPLSAEADFQQ